MEKLIIKEIIPYLSAQLVSGSEDTEFTGVSIDSRTIQEGDIFFPFAGKNVDAHQFILDALEKGASCSVATWDWPVPAEFPPDKSLIRVGNILKALQELASFYRQRLDIPYIVGITGSNGKTTTKDLIASVVKEKFNTLKTKGNYNNEIGVPLTLFGLRKEHQAAVVEMGMRGLGEIRELAEIIHPNIGVITNVGETHLEVLGSKENIARAKGELVEAIPEKGWVVLNADDPLVVQMADRAKGSILYYGFGEQAQIRAADIQSQGERGMCFTLVIDNEQIEIKLPLLGQHNVYNALAAAGVGKILNLELPLIKKGLETVELTSMRLEVMETEAGVKIINDAYNASPASMAGALEILHDLSSEREGRAIAILGNMYELGEYTNEAHGSIGRLAFQLKVDLLLTIGDLASQIAQGAVRSGMDEGRIKICSSNQEALKALPVLQEGDTVLIKGSRSMRMEEIVESFRGNL